jgi:hypothetical protein
LFLIENTAEIGFIRISSYGEGIEDDVNIVVSGLLDNGVVIAAVDNGNGDDSVLLR